MSPRTVAVVGHAADKFTPTTEARARETIRGLLALPGTVLVSGGCHLGGVDIFAEEEADALGVEKIVHLPEEQRWSTGYRPRNLRIAADCTVAHCVVHKCPCVYGCTTSYWYHEKRTRHRERQNE